MIARFARPEPHALPIVSFLYPDAAFHSCLRHHKGNLTGFFRTKGTWVLRINAPEHSASIPLLARRVASLAPRSSAKSIKA